MSQFIRYDNRLINVNTIRNLVFEKNKAKITISLDEGKAELTGDIEDLTELFEKWSKQLTGENA